MAYIKHGKIYYNKRKIPGLIGIVVILLLETCFMSIPVLSSIFFKYNNYHDKRILLLVCLILTLITCKKNMKKTNIDILVAFFLLAGMFIAAFSAVTTSSVGTIVNRYYYYAIVLLYYPLGKLFDSTDDLYDSFLRLMSLMGIVYATYFIIAKLVYDTTGALIINQSVQHLQMRSGLRLARPCDFLCFSFLSTLCLLVKEKKKGLHWGLLIIGIYIFWVGQTRLYELIIAALFIAYLLLYTKANLKVVAVVTVIASWDSIKNFYHNFMASFSAKDTLSSTIARTQGYEIVKNDIFKHYIWGAGFDGKFQFSLAGWNYALSDLGIVGYFSVWGLLGIFFVTMVVLRFLLNIRYIVKNQLVNHCPETIFLAIWFAGSCVSVSFSDVQRILYLPLMLLMLRQNSLIWKGDRA